MIFNSCDADLQIHQHDSRIFNCSFDCSEIVNTYIDKERKPMTISHNSQAAMSTLPEECNSFTSINETMIVCKSDVHHGSDGHLTVPHHRPLKHSMHSKNGRLWRVDDGGSKQGSKHSTIAENYQMCQNKVLQIVMRLEYLMVKVPPSMSSTASSLFLAFCPRAAIPFSMSA